jgi:hypothetical protein
MTTVRELVTDLDDSDVFILRRLMWRIGKPSEERGAWPARVEAFFHSMSVVLDEELCRRRRMVAALDAIAEDDGAGALVAEDDEDLSGWGDAA